ncbi:hypothetical protein ACVW19_006236 [Streptomyces sp. TE5632]
MERAAQLTAIDPDWNCPWPLDWQHHYRVFADLAVDEPHGSLPDIAPGMQFDGDDLGKWLKRQKQPSTWKLLSSEQQERLTRLGIKPLEAPAATRAMKGPPEQGAAGVPARPGGPRAVGGAGRSPAGATRP